MKPLFQFPSTRIGISLLLIAFSPAVFADGSIITTNLPSGSAIINIDGRDDGGASYSGTGQDFWYQPFAISGNLVEYTFQPGTYTFRIIDPTDSTALFPSLTSSQLATIYTAWTYNSPYVTQWLAWDVSALSDSSVAQLMAGSVDATNTNFTNAADAYNAAISGGYYDQVVSGGGRYSGTSSASFTFTSSQTLVFGVPDYALGDNAGGVSVLIQGAPEPATMAPLLIGAMAALLRRRRR